jgi:hypothetical protein
MREFRGRQVLISLGSILVFLAVMAVARFVLGSPRADPWVKNLNIAQSVLTILAAVVAASWYFVDRPHATKLKFDQSVVGVPAGPGKVMVLAEITISNVSSSSIRLQNSPFRLIVQRVTPLPPGPTQEVGSKDTTGAFLIHPADDWSELASRHDQLNTFLEVGETENLYYRVVIPCSPGLHIYFSSWFDKPHRFTDAWIAPDHVAWIKQSLADLSGTCPAAGVKSS